MEFDQIKAALLGVLNAPNRFPALRPLGSIKYPNRQLRVAELPDGTVVATLYHRYKNHSPAPVDAEMVRLTLNALLPNGLYIYAVEDLKTHIQLNIRRYSI